MLFEININQIAFIYIYYYFNNIYHQQTWKLHILRLLDQINLLLRKIYGISSKQLEQ